MPLSIPAGMSTWSFVGLDMYPAPRHSGHFSFIIFPLPRQSGHTVSVCIMPKMDCCVEMMRPVPLHFEQVCGVLPGFAPFPPQVGQGSRRFRSICFSQPNTASSNVMLTAVLTLAPRIGPFEALLEDRRPPPNRSPNRSPKMSLMSAPLKSKPPKPPCSKAA